MVHNLQFHNYTSEKSTKSQNYQYLSTHFKFKVLKRMVRQHHKLLSIKKLQITVVYIHATGTIFVIAHVYLHNIVAP